MFARFFRANGARSAAQQSAPGQFRRRPFRFYMQPGPAFFRMRPQITSANPSGGQGQRRAGEDHQSRTKPPVPILPPRNRAAGHGKCSDQRPSCLSAKSPGRGGMFTGAAERGAGEMRDNIHSNFRDFHSLDFFPQLQSLFSPWVWRAVPIGTARVCKQGRYGSIAWNSREAKQPGRTDRQPVTTPDTKQGPGKFAGAFSFSRLCRPVLAAEPSLWDQVCDHFQGRTCSVSVLVVVATVPFAVFAVVVAKVHAGEQAYGIAAAFAQSTRSTLLQTGRPIIGQVVPQGTVEAPLARANSAMTPAARVEY